MKCHKGCLLFSLFSAALFLVVLVGGTVVIILRPSVDNALTICNELNSNTGGVVTTVPFNASVLDPTWGTVNLPHQFSISYRKLSGLPDWHLCISNSIYTTLPACADNVPPSFWFCLTSTNPASRSCLPASYIDSRLGISLWDSTTNIFYYYIFDMESVFQYQYYSYDNVSTLNDMWSKSYNCGDLFPLATVCGALVIFLDCCCFGMLWCCLTICWVKKRKKLKSNPNFFANYGGVDNHSAPGLPQMQNIPPNHESIAGNGVPVPRPGPPPMRTLPHNNRQGLGPDVSDLLSGRRLNMNPPPTAGDVVHVPGPPSPVPPHVDNPASRNGSHFPGVAIRNRPYSNDRVPTPDVEPISAPPPQTPRRLPPKVEIHPVPPSSTHLDLPSLKHRIIPMVAAKWESFGLYLGVEYACRQKVKRNHLMDCERACEEMLKLWLTNDTGTGDRPRTWATVIDALEEEGYRAQAQALRDRL